METRNDPESRFTGGYVIAVDVEYQQETSSSERKRYREFINGFFARSILYLVKIPMGSKRRG